MEDGRLRRCVAGGVVAELGSGAVSATAALAERAGNRGGVGGAGRCGDGCTRRGGDARRALVLA